MSTPEHENDEVQERLARLAAAGDTDALQEAVAEMHPSDLADVVESLEDEHQVMLLSALPADLASETLAEMEEGDERAELLAALEPARGAELLSELPDDDAADLVAELEPEERRRLLEALPLEDAGDIRGLLRYDEETAGGLMTTELVSVAVTLTAGQALDRVRVLGREVEDFYSVFVVDDRDRLLGTMRLDHLVTADPGSGVTGLVEPPVATVLPDMDQEEVGRLISRYNLASIPVVNEFGVLLGRITFDDVIDVMEAEHTEDILRLAGVTDPEALRSTWSETVWARLRWLFVNLLTAFLAASVVWIFQGTVDRMVALAVAMPIVAGMGGNAGTQALAVAVRSLALKEDLGGRAGLILVFREVGVGLVNGVILGVVTALAALAMDESVKFGLVVMLAMWGNLVVAGFAGSVVPMVLDRLGIDPAVASSVFVTTFTDMCGFFLLLGLASAILS
ncbi:MAG: magnesium transporter [Gemmatimonadetes bacterium]|nr:magnesium transporter [Gemmatimonadota bacterium]